jgi:curved DNA-binding protein CbpA
MADIGSLIKQYLKVSPPSRRLNYYTILGLEEFSDDTGEILAAVEATVEKLKAIDRLADPSGLEQVIKVVRQARGVLTDATRKATYDQQLRATLLPPQVSRDAGSARLHALLPSGDPDAPFSLSEFLKNTTDAVTAESVAERQSILEAWIASSANPTRIPDSANTPMIPPPAMAVVPAAGLAKARELQSRIRRNRRKKNLITSSLILGFSLVTVLASAAFYWFNSQPATQLTQAANSSLTRENMSPELLPADDELLLADTDKPRLDLGVDQPSPTGKVGALPKIAAVTADAPSTPESTTAAVVEDSPQMKPDALPIPTATVPTSPPPTEASPTPPGPADSSPPAAIPTMASITPAAETTGNTAMQDAVAAQSWSKAMNQARQAIQAQDFVVFHREIERALGISVNEEKMASTRRLDALGQAFEKGIELVQQSLRKLKAGEEITYGSLAKAAVVEVKEEAIILRLQGENRTYRYDKIPMGIIVGLLQSQLTESPVDQLILGALYLLDPRSNDVTRPQAKRYFDKAAESDDKYRNLEEVLKDTY